MNNEQLVEELAKKISESNEYTEDKPNISDRQFDRELFKLIEITRKFGTTNSLELASEWMRAIYKNSPSKIHSEAASVAHDYLFNLLTQLESA